MGDSHRGNRTVTAYAEQVAELRARHAAQPPCELCPPATLADMRADRLDPNDPNIRHLAKLAATYHDHTRNAETAKAALDRQLAALKAQGYSYPVLAKTAGIAIASVQYAVAKEASK